MTDGRSRTSGPQGSPPPWGRQAAPLRLDGPSGLQSVPGRLRVGVTVLGGAIAWSAHLTGAWLLSEFRCLAPAPGAGLLGDWGTTALLLALSAAALAASSTATWVGWVDRRRLSAEQAPHLFLARFGFLTNGIFALAIAFQTLPILYFLREC
jgi:hypothetical protein